MSEERNQLIPITLALMTNAHINILRLYKMYNNTGEDHEKAKDIVMRIYGTYLKELGFHDEQ